MYGHSHGRTQGDVREDGDALGAHGTAAVGQSQALQRLVQLPVNDSIANSAWVVPL